MNKVLQKLCQETYDTLNSSEDIEECFENPALFIEVVNYCIEEKNHPIVIRFLKVIETLFWGNYEEDELLYFFSSQEESGKEIVCSYFLTLLEFNIIACHLDGEHDMKLTLRDSVKQGILCLCSAYNVILKCVYSAQRSADLIKQLHRIQKFVVGLFTSDKTTDNAIFFSSAKFVVSLLITNSVKDMSTSEFPPWIDRRNWESEVFGLYSVYTKKFEDLISELLSSALDKKQQENKHLAAKLTSLINALETLLKLRTSLFFVQSIEMLSTFFNEVNKLLYPLVISPNSNDSLGIINKLRFVRKSIKNTFYFVIKNYDIAALRGASIDLIMNALAFDFSSFVQNQSNHQLSPELLRQHQKDLDINIQPLEQILGARGIKRKSSKKEKKEITLTADQLTSLFITTLENYSNSINLQKLEMPSSFSVSVIPVPILAQIIVAGIKAYPQLQMEELKKTYNKLLQDFIQQMQETEEVPMGEYEDNALAGSSDAVEMSAPFRLTSSKSLKFRIDDLFMNVVRASCFNTFDSIAVEDEVDVEDLVRLMETDGTPFLVDKVREFRKSGKATDLDLNEFKGSPVFWSVFLARYFHELIVLDEVSNTEDIKFKILEFIVEDFKTRWILALRLAWEEHYYYYISKTESPGYNIIKTLFRIIIRDSLDPNNVGNKQKFIPFLAGSKELFRKFLLMIPVIPRELFFHDSAELGDDELSGYLYKFYSEITGPTLTPLDTLKVTFSVEIVFDLIRNRIETRNDSLFVVHLMMFSPSNNSVKLSLLTEAFKELTSYNLSTAINDKNEWSKKLMMTMNLFFKEFLKLHTISNSEDDYMDISEFQGTVTERNLKKACHILRRELKSCSVHSCIHLFVFLILNSTALDSKYLLDSFIVFVNEHNFESSIKAIELDKTFHLIKAGFKTIGSKSLGAQPLSENDTSGRLFELILDVKSNEISPEYLYFFLVILDNWFTSNSGSSSQSSPLVVVNRPNEKVTNFIKRMLAVMKKSEKVTVEVVVMNYYLITSEYISTDLIYGLLLQMCNWCLDQNIVKDIDSIMAFPKEDATSELLFKFMSKNKDNFRLMICFTLINVINFHNLSPSELLSFLLTYDYTRAKKGYVNVSLSVVTTIIKLCLQHPLLQPYFTLKAFQSSLINILNSQTPPIIFMFTVQGLIVKYRKDSIVLQQLLKEFLMIPITLSSFRQGMKLELKKTNVISSEDKKCKSLFIGWLDCLHTAAPESFEVLLKFGNQTQVTQILDMVISRERKKSNQLETDGFMKQLESWLNEKTEENIGNNLKQQYMMLQNAMSSLK